MRTLWFHYIMITDVIDKCSRYNYDFNMFGNVDSHRIQNKYNLDEFLIDRYSEME